MHNFSNLANFCTFRRIEEYPFFRITGPPEYENMSTLDVFKTLDWTNEALRTKYQDLLLQENADMQYECAKGLDPIDPVRFNFPVSDCEIL